MNILILKDGSPSSSLMLTPVLKALSSSGHSVYLLINSGADFPNMEGLFNDLEYVDGVKGFDATKEKNGDATIAWIVSNKIDVCIESFPSNTGFKWLYPYLDCEAIIRAPRISETHNHEVDINLEMVKNIIGENPSSLYDIPHYSFKHIDALLAPFEDKVKVVVCPSFKKDGIDVKKNWGIENYARFINLLSNDFKVILVDDYEGIGICNHIEHLAPAALNLAGLLNLEECMAAIDSADVVISNDSYLAHLAAGLDKFLMVFFRDDEIEKRRPVGPKTIILKANANEHKCFPASDHDGCFCIGSIPPESVYNAVVKYILPELDKEKKAQPIGV